jgi:hypothetical protein
VQFRTAKKKECKMFEKTIESPHGMGQLDAVFEAKSASYNENSSANFTYGQEEDSNENTNNSINYEMYYWVSAEARLAYIEDETSSNRPMIWVNAEQSNTNFYANSLDSSYDLLSVKEKAEKHCEEVTLA